MNIDWMTKKFFLALLGFLVGCAGFFMDKLDQDGFLWVLGISVAPYTLGNSMEKVMHTFKNGGKK
jgi:hypothetical protein